MVRKLMVFFCMLITVMSVLASTPPVLPTSTGIVTGAVYDAQTSLPLKGVCIFLLDQNKWLSETTDDKGKYTFDAHVGRVDSEAATFGEVLNSSPLELLFGKGSKKTKWVNVTNFPIKVECKGYSSYQGIAAFEKIDATNKMVVSLSPLLLSSTESQVASTLAPGWGILKVLDVSANPPVVLSSESTTITVRVQGPISSRPSGMEIEFFAISTPNVKFSIRNMTKPTMGENGILIFQTSVKAPKVKSATRLILTATITDNILPVIFGEGSKQGMMQIIDNNEELNDAQKEIDTFAKDNNSKAIEKYNDKLSEITLPNVKEQDVSMTDIDLDSSIATAKMSLGKNCKDFLPWHTYGQLLYKKAVVQMDSSNIDEAKKTLKECQESLLQGIQYQKGSVSSISKPTPTLINLPSAGISTTQTIGGSVDAISGFASNEAQCDFILATKTTSLMDNRSDSLIHLQLATAFLGVDNLELAKWHLVRYRTVNQNCVEGKYLLALIDLRQGNIKEALNY
ncbi:MAG: hypothetical protein WCO98_15850 [bacterium]